MQSVVSEILVNTVAVFETVTKEESQITVTSKGRHIIIINILSPYQISISKCHKNKIDVNTLRRRFLLWKLWEISQNLPLKKLQRDFFAVETFDLF